MGERGVIWEKIRPNLLDLLDGPGSDDAAADDGDVS